MLEQQHFWLESAISLPFRVRFDDARVIGAKHGEHIVHPCLTNVSHVVAVLAEAANQSYFLQCLQEYIGHCASCRIVLAISDGCDSRHGSGDVAI